MAFSIRNPDAERMAREIVSITGESLTSAVTGALQERLARLKTREQHNKEARLAAIQEIVARISKLPTLSHASDDEIFGWDECGLPT
jgi:antitoxin VapB